MDKDFEKELLRRLDNIENRQVRTESKITHLMDVQGVVTVNTKQEELKPSSIYLKIVEGRHVIEVLNKDVSISIIEKFLSNKMGEFDIVCKDKVIWKIKK